MCYMWDSWLKPFLCVTHWKLFCYIKYYSIGSKTPVQGCDYGGKSSANAEAAEGCEYQLYFLKSTALKNLIMPTKKNWTTEQLQMAPCAIPTSSSVDCIMWGHQLVSPWVFLKAIFTCAFIVPSSDTGAANIPRCAQFATDNVAGNSKQ